MLPCLLACLIHRRYSQSETKMTYVNFVRQVQTSLSKFVKLQHNMSWLKLLLKRHICVFGTLMYTFIIPMFIDVKCLTCKLIITTFFLIIIVPYLFFQCLLYETMSVKHMNTSTFTPYRKYLSVTVNYCYYLCNTSPDVCVFCHTYLPILKTKSYFFYNTYIAIQVGS